MFQFLAICSFVSFVIFFFFWAGSDFKNFTFLLSMANALLSCIAWCKLGNMESNVKKDKEEISALKARLDVLDPPKQEVKEAVEEEKKEIPETKKEEVPKYFPSKLK